MAANPAVNTKLLDAIIASNPALQKSSGISAANAAADPSLASPVTTPSTGVVTATTLVAAWGPTVAATVDAALRAQVAGGGSAGAQAQVILGILYGPGFNPSDPTAQALMASYVTAGLITQDQANAISVTSSYRTNVAPGADDVTASWARLQGRANAAAIKAQVASYAAAVEASNGPAALATLQSAIAALTA